MFQLCQLLLLLATDVVKVSFSWPAVPVLTV